MKNPGLLITLGILVILSTACTGTNTQLSVFPPFLPAVAPVNKPAPNEFKLNVGVGEIEAGANLEVAGESFYRTIANNGELPAVKEAICKELDGTEFPCDAFSGAKIIPSCKHSFVLAVKANTEAKWAEADVPVGPASGSCHCFMDNCRGKVTLQVRNSLTGQALPGPHTSATITWDESGLIAKQILFWNN